MMLVMDKKELKDKILSFLENHKKAVVAIVGKDNEPSTSLMLYTVDEDLNVYLGTRKAFGKYKALKINPKLALTVIQEKLDPLRAVDIYGNVEFIPDKDVKERLEWFESKNNSKYYIKGAEDFVMFRVKPYRVKYLDATSGELIIEDLEF